MTMRIAADPRRPSSTSKCSFPLLVRSGLAAVFVLSIAEQFMNWKSPLFELSQLALRASKVHPPHCSVPVLNSFLVDHEQGESIRWNRNGYLIALNR